MSPAEEGVEDLDVHAAGFFEKETAAGLEDARDLIHGLAPVGNVVQNAKDDDHILARVGELT